MEKLCWGIIGCGNVTEIKSGPAFNKVSNSELVAVMRRDASKAKDYAQRHEVPKWFDDVDALIHDPAINAIYIATPPHVHEAYTIAALEAGKPVYVEKPMATNLAACMRMKAMVDKTGVKLVVAHYRRALPMFQFIKKLLADKVIGEIRTIHLRILQPDQSLTIAQTETNWRVDPSIAGAGLFFDLAPHQLDLMMYFFGDPKLYMGLSANQAALYEAEDVVTGIIQFQHKELFTGQWCFTTAVGMAEDLVEINGSNGKISFPVFGYDVTLTTAEKSEVTHFAPPTHIQQPMIQKVTDFFLGKADNPCSAEDAILSMKVMEQFVK